jgi:hypothetical protein
MVCVGHGLGWLLSSLALVDLGTGWACHGLGWVLGGLGLGWAARELAKCWLWSCLAMGCLLFLPWAGLAVLDIG